MNNHYKPKRIRDKDILAIKGSLRSLQKSTSKIMLKANLEFIWDKLINHPKTTQLKNASGHPLEVVCLNRK